MIKLETNFYSLKIFIDNTLHLSLKIKDVVAVHSWIHRQNKYIIEFTLQTTTVKCEYQDKAIWQEILKQLEQIEFN